MRAWHTILAAGVALTLVAIARPSQAQQVTLATPFHTAHDSFFEQSSINWSGNYRGVNFSYGGGALARPQFGGADPSAGMSLNFGLAGKNGRINFATNFASGYHQSLTSQTPSVTVMNGQTGYVSDTSLTPFVISVIPVVGAFPTAPQPFPQVSSLESAGINPHIQEMLQARADAQAQAAARPQAGGQVPPPPQPGNLRQPAKPAPEPPPAAAPEAGDALAEQLEAAQESSAGRPAPSVAEARRMYQQEQSAVAGEMAALMVRGQALEEDGKPNVAKIYYQRVARHASGALQQQARDKLRELQGASH